MCVCAMHEVHLHGSTFFIVAAAVVAAIVVCMPRKCHIFMNGKRRKRKQAINNFANHLQIVTRRYTTHFSILSSPINAHAQVPSWHIE